MSKRSDKRRAKKKAQKEHNRKIIAKQKISNIRKSNQDTKEKSEGLKDTLNGLQKDIREQVNNIDEAKKVCKALNQFVHTVVTKRLDIPYLNDDIKDKFKGMNERIVNTLNHIDDIRNKFIETSIKIQDPGKLKADMDSLKKYSDVLNGAQELMNMQSSLINFGAECTQIIRDINKLVIESDQLRKDYGDISLMPIATPEEKEFLGLKFDLETYEFKDKETDNNVEIPFVNGHEPEVVEEKVEETPTAEIIEDAEIVKNINEDESDKSNEHVIEEVKE